ncbi:hypothetical protein [Nocardia spumae]|uniref:hypothetical protein n=1 Tax=Nocardia spumae TaxID=2887190 RepID=UPI001D1384ED|nr:hypothetical protein [Nocardia spumae]
MDDTLSDDPDLAELPVAQQCLSYAEITGFYNELRVRFDWTDVDLDAALSSDHRAELQAWRERHRQVWSTRDVAAVGIAGLVGALCVWFDATVDRPLGNRFHRLADGERGRGREREAKRLPIDFLGAQFGGRADRIASGGHELLRIFTTLRQILAGEFHGTRNEDSPRIEVTAGDRFDRAQDWPDAARRLMQHLATEFLTPMSLPMPGMSWLRAADSEITRQFALHAYSDMRAGEGWNQRDATMVPPLPTTMTELLIRTHTCAESYRESGSFTPSNDRYRRKQNELLLAAHTLVAAASLGTATAQLLAIRTERGVLDPAIRHLQLPALVRAGWLAINVVGDARSATEHPARSWDELVLQMEELDLPGQLASRIEG